MKREPDFSNILKILKREKPNRPTLFEFFLNVPLYEKLVGEKVPETIATTEYHNFMIKAFKKAGYDYATTFGSQFCFPTESKSKKHTASLNEGASITDRASFEAYKWPEPDDFDYSALKDVSFPGNMKLMVCAPGGVLEHAVALMGYENLCIMLYDDPQLVRDVFNGVGSRLLRYYENCINYDTVGLLMSNDDWGFKTQTMLSVKHMREYVFPWHKKIVDLAHDAGKPAILHSCGYHEKVMDDIINVMKYDGKHSYEDIIMPVEEAYTKWGNHIAILGGIDLHFIVSKTPVEIHERCKAMLEHAQSGYALGTGNSVPEYVPFDNYFAMTGSVM